MAAHDTAQAVFDLIAFLCRFVWQTLRVAAQILTEEPHLCFQLFCGGVPDLATTMQHSNGCEKVFLVIALFRVITFDRQHLVGGCRQKKYFCTMIFCPEKLLHQGLRFALRIGEKVAELLELVEDDQFRTQ